MNRSDACIFLLLKPLFCLQAAAFALEIGPLYRRPAAVLTGAFQHARIRFAKNATFSRACGILREKAPIFCCNSGSGPVWLIQLSPAFLSKREPAQAG
jgi:hypothetical protein